MVLLFFSLEVLWTARRRRGVPCQFSARAKTRRIALKERPYGSPGQSEAPALGRRMMKEESPNGASLIVVSLGPHRWGLCGGWPNTQGVALGCHRIASSGLCLLFSVSLGDFTIPSQESPSGPMLPISPLVEDDTAHLYNLAGRGDRVILAERSRRASSGKPVVAGPRRVSMLASRPLFVRIPAFGP